MIWLGAALIAINLLMRWRWRWVPNMVTALGVVIGGYLIASEFLLSDRDRSMMMGVTVIFGGGLYLMALVGLALRAHLERQRVQSGGAAAPSHKSSVPSIGRGRAPR